MSDEKREGSEAIVDRVQIPNSNPRPTVEINGRPLSAGFPVETIDLEILTGTYTKPKLSFEKTVIRIGADPLNDVILTDPTVSRMHAEIRRIGKNMHLIDLESTNGTFIDQNRIASIEIPPDTLFQIGRTDIRVSIKKEKIPISLTQQTKYGSMVGQSIALREIFTILERIAPSELSIIIEGETGTGKELIARAVHDQSLRADKPFVIFDCSAFPGTLLESELFGHEKGAFSGAFSQHRGVFERAHEGTIFFDELGEMDIEFQPKFLRVLETGDVRRVGGESTFHVDVRVVAATNQNLEDLVRARKFRQDLFYRLAKVHFHLPPLRDRLEDIPLLAHHFLSLFAGSKSPLSMEENALEVLQSYDWPGNIRQLKNVIEKAIAFNDGSISASYFQSELSTAFPRKKSFAPTELSQQKQLLPFREAKDKLVNHFEKQYLIRLIEENKNNISAAARYAKIDRRHLYRLLKKHDLQ